MLRLTPNYDPSVTSLRFYRGFRELDLKVCYPNGDTYLIEPDEARRLLRRWKLSPYDIDRAIDAVWNCYAIELDLTRGLWEPIEPEPEDTWSGIGPLDRFRWILGSNNDQWD